MKKLINVSLILMACFYGMPFAAAGIVCSSKDRALIVVNYAPEKKSNCMHVWLAKLESYALTCNVTFDGTVYRGRGIKFGKTFRASANSETSETKIQGKKVEAVCVK